MTKDKVLQDGAGQSKTVEISAGPEKPTHLGEKQGGGAAQKSKNASPSNKEEKGKTERLLENMIDEKLESMTQEIAEMLSDKIQWKDLDEEVYELRTENNELWSRVKLLEGRCARSEKLITDLKEEVLQIQSEQMKDNLIFYNIPEKKRENKKDTRKILVKFLKEEMKISEEEMKAVHWIRYTEMVRLLSALINHGSSV